MTVVHAASSANATVEPGGGGPGGPGGDRGGMRGPMAPSDAEWKVIEAFAEKHSPNRLKMLNKLRDENPRDFRFGQAFLVGRYRSLESTKDHDPDLYAERLENVELGGSNFRSGRGGRAQADAPAEKKDALRADMVKWVQMSLKRARSLDRVAESLEEHHETRARQGQARFPGRPEDDRCRTRWHSRAHARRRVDLWTIRAADREVRAGLANLATAAEVAAATVVKGPSRSTDHPKVTRMGHHLPCRKVYNFDS